MNPSIFLEKVDNINFRNRQTLLTDFFDSGLNKINSEIFQKEKGTMSKILSDFNERTGSQIEMLQKALKDPQMSKEILKEDFAPKNFEGQIFSFVDNLKKTVFTLTSHHINAVFKPEQIILEDSNKKEQTVAKEKKPRKNNKKNERNFFFDEEDGKSISTNISQNHKNQELTLNEEKKYEDSDPQDDFLEKDKKDYKVNVIGPESNIIQSNPVQKKKRNAGKTEKSLENKSKKKKASNQEKQQDYNMPEKSENKSVKFDENSNSKLPQKSFFDQYLNPKKRKEDMVITKPEKMEKKEPNIMNAEQFLGALLEKKDVPFKKQRVFANSPLGSKSKDKKSGDFF